MDAGVVDEVDDGLVALLVLVAQVLGQVDEQLPAHGLVAVHVGDVLKLWLACSEKQEDACCVTASHTQCCNSTLCIPPSSVQCIQGESEQTSNETQICT